MNATDDPPLRHCTPPLPSSSLSGRGDRLPTVICGRGGVPRPCRVESGRDGEPYPTVATNQEAGSGPHFEAREPRNVDVRMSGSQLPSTIQCTELARAILQVSKLPGAYHHFAQRSMKEFRSDEEGPEVKRTDPGPCPPPRWRHWTAAPSPSPRRRRRLRLLETKALCVQQLVLALNWLCLGFAKSPPIYARAGYPMSAQQHAMVERLEDLVDHYLGGPAVQIDSLGRAGEKLTSLGKLAFRLHDPSTTFTVDDLSSFLNAFNKVLNLTHVIDI